MFRVRKILVPTDFSECACLALHYSAELAKAFDAEILIAHVREPFDYAGYGLGPETMLQIRQDLDTAVETNLREAQAECGGWQKTSLLSLEGTPSYEIVEAAKKHDADLIVIATRGLSGVKHMLLGSTAERVLRLAPCPVLTVREGQRALGTG